MVVPSQSSYFSPRPLAGLEQLTAETSSPPLDNLMVPNGVAIQDNLGAICSCTDTFREKSARLRPIGDGEMSIDAHDDT